VECVLPGLCQGGEAPEQAVPLSREYLGLLVWMGLPTAALGWALGRHVVEVLYGTAFAPAGRHFEWLCLAIALNFINYGVVSPLVPWGRGGLQLRMTASAAALNLLVTAVAVLLALPHSLDRLWWLQMAIAAVLIGLCMLAVERHTICQAWRTFRSR
jgi:O-antigen/teichoic acid export membrane protein